MHKGVEGELAKKPNEFVSSVEAAVGGNQCHNGHEVWAGSMVWCQ